MNEQELNRKLAEWVGFYRCSAPSTWWMLPTKKTARPHLPNFLNDLNACKKYLWPEILVRQGYYFELRSPYKGIPYCFIIGKHDEHEAWTLYSGESDNPATAICLACEKLIDGVK